MPPVLFTSAASRVSMSLRVKKVSNEFVGKGERSFTSAKVY